MTSSLKDLSIAHCGIPGQLGKTAMRVLFQGLVAVSDRGKVELVCLNYLNVVKQQEDCGFSKSRDCIRHCGWCSSSSVEFSDYGIHQG